MMVIQPMNDKEKVKCNNVWLSNSLLLYWKNATAISEENDSYTANDSVSYYAECSLFLDDLP